LPGIFLALLLLCADSAVDPAAGAAEDGFSSESALQARRGELRALKGRITEKRRQIEQLRREGQDVEAILVELERERSLGERYVRTLETQEHELERDIAHRRADLSRKEESLIQVRAGLAQALVRFYKEERVTAAELLVSSTTFSEIFARSHYWGRTVHRLRGRVQDLALRRQELREGLAEVEARRARALSLKRERETQIRCLREEEGVRREHRRELECSIALYEEQARKLLAAQGQIEKLIADAQRAAAAGIGTGLDHLRGQLPWPVRGRIVTRFGTQIHPKYGTRIRQKGIEIAAAEGTPIHAVAPGRVVYADWLEGYGRTVILDHGQDRFTLYAHASETLVGRGAAVHAGQEIARVGSTDSLKGATLHFEIRKGSQALDPAAWLKKDGGR
jgi:septal ring factor EnvC (AmiA/AmiB activator)